MEDVCLYYKLTYDYEMLAQVSLKWLDELGFYVPSTVFVISRRWKGEHERLCAMKRRLGSGRISPPAGFEPVTL